jgi:hypothetical protein
MVTILLRGPSDARPARDHPVYGSGSVPNPDGWECQDQPATPEHGGSRPDLCLIRPSKSGAKIGESSLKRPQFLEALATSLWPSSASIRTA